MYTRDKRRKIKVNHFYMNDLVSICMLVFWFSVQPAHFGQTLCNMETVMDFRSFKWSWLNGFMCGWLNWRQKQCFSVSRLHDIINGHVLTDRSFRPRRIRKWRSKIGKKRELCASENGRGKWYVLNCEERKNARIVIEINAFLFDVNSIELLLKKNRTIWDLWWVY